MAETKGIKETKEAALALIKVGAAAVKLVKDAKADGKIDLADLPALMALLQDQALVEAIKAGVDKVEEVPAEVADMSIAEVIEFGQEVIPAAIEVLKAVKA